MDTRVTVTQEQLLAELLSAKRSGEFPAGAFRSKELKRALGWSMDAVRETLAELKELGIVECVHISVETLSGKSQTVPHYRIIDGEDVDGLIEAILDRNKESNND